jgi:ribosomal protein S12 methylthiotransferase
MRGDLAGPIADVLRGRAAGEGGRQGDSGDLPGHLAYGLDIKYRRASKWKARGCARFLDLSRELGRWASGCGSTTSTPIRMSTGHPADGRGQDPALSRHPVPARRPFGAEGDAPSGGNQEKTLDRIKSWRESAPDLAIRSTFIVGFPGETEEDFEFLLDWLEEASSTASAASSTSRSRRAANDLGLPGDGARGGEGRALASLHGRASRPSARGASSRAASASASGEGSSTTRRTASLSPRAAAKWDAPEIDGNVYVSSRRPLRPGDIVTVKVERADAYDLHGIAV